MCNSLSWGQMKINVTRLMRELVNPHEPWRGLCVDEFDASNDDDEGKVQACQVDVK